MTKLTVRTVLAAKAGERDLFIWDDELAGFGLRVKPSGVKSYLIQYRNLHNQSRRHTIGRHGVFSPEKAREKARRMLADSQDGADPAKERKAARIAPSVAELAERYLDPSHGPEAVAETCGIPAATIKRIAAELAHAAFEEEVVLDVP